MQFDWYQATIPGVSPRTLIEGLEALEPGAVRVEGRGRQGYQAASAIVLAGGERLAEVWYGGPNGVAGPHLVASGEAARIVTPWVREGWPSHRVTRADACEDFQRPGVFADLASKALAVADRAGVSVEHRGDWHRALAGRTLYLGSTSSPVRSRLYEKGIELRARMPDLYQSRLREVYPDDLVRLEVQVRPRSPEARQRAASMSPVEFWGFGAWSASLWEAVAGEQVRRELVDKGFRPDDYQRAYGWMLASYRRVLEKMHQDHGDWACVGMQIGTDLENMGRVRAEVQRVKEQG